MVGYPETPRGAIRNPAQIARIRDFTGLRWGNITPTDIDGLIEFYNKAYVILEAKMGDAMPPTGQKLALERLADDLGRTKPTLLLLLRMEPAMPEPINYASLAVSHSREHGTWDDVRKGQNCKSAIDAFLGKLA